MLTFKEYTEKCAKPKEGSADTLQDKARADAIAKHNFPSDN